MRLMYKLALALGKTVAELMEQMPVAELDGWRVYLEHEAKLNTSAKGKAQWRK